MCLNSGVEWRDSESSEFAYEVQDQAADIGIGPARIQGESPLSFLFVESHMWRFHKEAHAEGPHEIELRFLGDEASRVASLTVGACSTMANSFPWIT